MVDLGPIDISFLIATTTNVCPISTLRTTFLAMASVSAKRKRAQHSDLLFLKCLPNNLDILYSLLAGRAEIRDNGRSEPSDNLTSGAVLVHAPAISRFEIVDPNLREETGFHCIYIYCGNAVLVYSHPQGCMQAPMGDRTLQAGIIV